MLAVHFMREFSRAEKARFYRMAKRSATECAGVLDVCRVLRLTDEKVLAVGREMLLRVVAMLIRMVQAVESGTGRGPGTKLAPADPPPS